MVEKRTRVFCYYSNDGLTMLPFLIRRSLLASVASVAIAAGGGGPQLSEAELAAKAKAEVQHQIYAKRTLVILAAVVAGLALYWWTVYSIRYVRTLACLNNATQRYFRIPSPTFANIKQHLLYAPTFKKRHHQAFRFFNLNCGILPSRFQSIFFLGVIVMNVTFCTYRLAWQGPRKTALSQLRNRTGTLAVVNMIPLVVMAGRNNPMIAFLNLSFDTFNLLHRLFGRVVAVQAVVHSVAHVMIKVDKGMIFHLVGLRLTDSFQVDGIFCGMTFSINSLYSRDFWWVAQLVACRRIAQGVLGYTWDVIYPFTSKLNGTTCFLRSLLAPTYCVGYFGPCRLMVPFDWLPRAKISTRGYCGLGL